MLDRSSWPARRRIQPHLIRTKDSAVQAEPWTVSLETERMLREMVSFGEHVARRTR